MERIRKETNEYTITIMNMNHEIEKLKAENQSLVDKTNEFALEKQRIETKKNAEISALQREKKQYESQMRASVILSSRQIHFVKN